MLQRLIQILRTPLSLRSSLLVILLLAVVGGAGFWAWDWVARVHLAHRPTWQLEEDEVVIQWEWDREAPAHFTYQHMTGPVATIALAKARKHEVRLVDLLPGSSYRFKISVADEFPLFTDYFTTRSSIFRTQPYVQRPTPDGMTIMYRLTKPHPSVVVYGLTEEMNQRMVMPADSEILRARLTGLQPATTYYYQVQASGFESKVSRFRTAPPYGTTKWRLGVYGDSRSNPAVHRRVARGLLEQNPDVIIHTGDLVFSGSNGPSWQAEFFGPAAPLLASVPVLPAIGNHEEDSPNYYEAFDLPDARRYYAYPFANARLIALDSNEWMTANGQHELQKRWLENTLLDANRPAWTLAYFHHPIFSAHSSRAISSLREYWGPTLHDTGFGVDAVISGHDHFYARNFPIARVGPEKQHGIWSFTSGGGGASLYNATKYAYVAKWCEAHHFSILDFDGDQIQLRVLDLEGTVIDEATYQKNASPASELCSLEAEFLREELKRTIGLRDFSPSKPMAVTHTFPMPIRGEWRWLPNGEKTPVEFRPKEPTMLPARPANSNGYRLELQTEGFRNRVLGRQFEEFVEKDVYE